MTEKDDQAPPVVEVAIEGEGIGLRTVSPRQVAELIEATVALFEAFGGSTNANEPQLALVGIREGSCVLLFEPRSAPARKVLTQSYDAIRERGRGAPPEVRSALRRMRRAGRVGGVRLQLHGLGGKKRKPVLRLSEPIEEVAVPVTEQVTLYGHLVGIARTRTDYSATIAPSAGSRIEVALSGALVPAARDLFDQQVRIEALATFRSEVTTQYSAVGLHPFKEASFLEEMAAVRAELERAGVVGDPLEMIRNLDS